MFAGDCLFLIEKSFRSSEIHADIAAVNALYNTCHNILLHLDIIIVDSAALFFPDLLKDHVLGDLCCDPAKGLAVDLHVDRVADCGGRAVLHGFIQRNLEQILGIAVVDRQEIILQIFANRATTREARLQVELAQLQYSLPRLKRKWGELSQQRGGVKGAKGSGEKQLELDRRQAQARIVRLKREIDEIGKSRDVQRRNRRQGNVPNVAIVGYTNSGKSTLLNRISDANVLSEDKLFATLDPTTRRVHLPGGGTALFTDTVGFVSDLPHELVDSFKSTLEEAVLADVLLIVLDASRDDFLMCWETTRSVLEDLKAFDKPRLVLLNKMDLVTEETLFAINSFCLSGERCLKVSVKDDPNLEEVLSTIENMISSKENP